ncbi:PQQ-dependent sugar dehydrogenase [Rubrimonas cliftonensis]|uniref:Glucose/arabinose dehydrogenase, beta-propeller fold n=1 Tax=Rubrimonas cliftonensis TaxID=89524 RepID=A0A1H4FP67_9RHOB|nr:PQQ-dependent sugar dehydrogenase [Rubrimonas cliftonensis]SEA98478.1 Glucose/arabinose dehydrogenase, beta-propeller fold [Rubrimonas cliftonensis]
MIRSSTAWSAGAWSAGAVVASALALAAPAASAQTPTLTSAVVLDSLEYPWDMAFLPDGGMLFTEKCRGLSVRLASGEVRRLLGMAGAEGYPASAEDLFCEGQAGMMGVAVDPDFAENRFIYVYSTSSMTAPGTNRLMRMTLGEDLASVADRTDIVDDIPYKPKASDHPFGGPGAHNGGRVRFSPGDGFLYVTTGDTHNGVVPQSPTLLGGKVLRIDRDGNPAPGNAAPEGFDPRIYTYGHRNVQGIAFRPGDSAAFVAEHGPWHSDEITMLVNGGNGGWDPRPNVGGRGGCPDDYCGYSPNQMDGMNPLERMKFMPMTDAETYPDAMRPAWNNNGYSQGTGSAAFLDGAQWGDWNGRMAVGVMGIAFGGTPPGERIDVIALGEDGSSAIQVLSVPADAIPPGRYRSVVQGPDGALYVATDQGEIFSISAE